MKFKLCEEKRKYKFYTDGNITTRVYEDEEPPIGFTPGRTFNSNPWNKGLTADTDERVKNNTDKAHLTYKNNNHIPWNKGLTKETDDRIKGLSGESNPMYGKHRVAWNKGLTKETDERVLNISNSNTGKTAWNKGISIKGHPHSEETKQHLRDVHLNPEFKKRRYEIMQNNGTLGLNSNTVAENDIYKDLIKTYGADGVIKQYFDKDRYPYKCDFYVPEEDLFVEVHGNWTHGGKPFDPNDEECIKQLEVWKEKAKTSNYYKNAIYTWTQLDVAKKDIAEKNNLNFKVIYYKYK